MNCRKYQKLIHRMHDGDLDAEKTRAVCVHLEKCPECRKVHTDLIRMCEALKEEDAQVPAGFRQRWKAHLEGAPAPKKRFRAGVAVPVAACCLAAVLGVSTLLNPQAFGLEGKSLTSEWFAVRPSALLEESMPPADPGPGQRVSSVSTTEKKPNVLDFASSNYSETTTKASGQTGLYEAGTIEPAANEIADGLEALVEEAGEPLPDETAEKTLTLKAGDEKENLVRLAEEMGLPVTEEEDRTVIAGTPEQIAQITSGFALEIPADAERIELSVE